MQRIFRKLYVPIDDSGHAFAAIDLAVDLAGRLEASIVGAHVDESSSSGAYLDLLEECCRNGEIPFQRKSISGHRHRALVEDLKKEPADLVVLGGLGAGATPESQIGSVAEGVARSAPADVLVVKSLVPEEDGGILIALDGSAPSMDALSAALALCRATGRPPTAMIVAEDSVAGAASKAVEAVRVAAANEGFDIDITVAEGKPFDRILQACRERRPWLLAIGRTGAGTPSEDRASSLGPTAANLLRLASCNILVAPGTRAATPRLKAASRPVAALPAPAQTRRSMKWTADAERLLEDVPAEQRDEMIRTVEEGARKLGTTVITAATIDRVMLGSIDS